jgi:uncharacterized membrane protein
MCPQDDFVADSIGGEQCDDTVDEAERPVVGPVPANRANGAAARRPRPQEGARRLEAGGGESRYGNRLPPPADLERYHAALSDAPERLLAIVEREQAHRHEIERGLVAIDEGEMVRSYAGQRRGHLISLGLGSGYEVIMLVAVLKGYALAGIGGAAAGIGSMIWAVRRSSRDVPAEADAPDSFASE